MPGAQWFPGTLVNYAEHVFRGKDDVALAIVAGGEDREDVEWTWGELRALTRRIAAGLRALGVERGDRVVAYMPNIPETAAAFLACASLGAVWSSCSPDFGARSRDRPLRADRAEGAARDPHATATTAASSTAPRRSTRSSARCRGCSTTAILGEDELGVADRARRGAGVRPRAVRPPAVGALFVRHHRAAEGDRPGPGRDPARAPEDAAPAPRRAGRRPAVLVHHDRLDDVELHRLRAADRRDGAALRRLARATRTWARCGTSRRARG